MNPTQSMDAKAFFLFDQVCKITIGTQSFIFSLHFDRVLADRLKIPSPNYNEQPHI